MTYKMAALLVAASALCLFGLVASGDPSYPIPYQRVSERPPNDPFCQAGVVPFCPTGRTSNTMPRFPDTDKLFVYALKAPVWEFKFGNLLAKYKIMHDAMGFHHVQSGANFTMEWYELDQLFNCTFPHERDNGSLVWCNQGAACIYDGIDEKHWRANGTLVKVAEINGTVFNAFANWTEYDNNTAVYYETWTVRDKPDGPMYFDSWECASWVQRAFRALGGYGARFNQSVHLNYTRMNVYSKPPILLGNYSYIFDNPSQQETAKDIRDFYKQFQAHQSMAGLVESLLKAFVEVVMEKRFYLYYNNLYWLLPVTKPYFKLTYEEVPLPAAQ